MEIQDNLSVPNIDLEPNKFLHKGFRDFHLDQGPIHPVQDLQQNGLAQSEIQRLKRLNYQFGGHAVFQSQMENNLLASCSRLPGIKSSYLGLQINLGLNDSIMIEELFANRSIDEPLPNISLQNLLEKAFSI